MVLMMVNLFTLIKYAGHIGRTTKLHPGNEPTTDEGWTSWTSNEVRHNPPSTYFMVLGQWGTSLTAWLAFEYEWQYIHYFMMGLLLLCISSPSLLCLIINIPPAVSHQLQAVQTAMLSSIFCITLTCITYVLTYGKVLW